MTIDKHLHLVQALFLLLFSAPLSACGAGRGNSHHHHEHESHSHEPRKKVKWVRELNPMQEAVTQRAATEPPFSGKYYRHNETGTYNCVVCDAPLFSSDDKFHSECGWPAFSEEMLSGAVTRHVDRSHGMVRTEVRCAKCGAHLGHLFDDGPGPNHQRFCINSASLHFDSPDGEKKEDSHRH